MKGVAIINPAAGGGRCGHRVDEALRKLNEAGVELDPYFTKQPGDATRLARDLWQRGHRTFIAVGGDGTGFEIINGLFPVTGEDIPKLGFLTLGTGNSFVRDHGIQNQQDAHQALVRGATTRCDVLRLEHTSGALHYINLMSIGFAARVASLTNKRFKSFGDGGYALAVVASLIRHQHPRFPYQIDSGLSDDNPSTLISFCNSRYTGGKMMMAPDASISDGQVDIIHIHKISRRRLLQAFPKIYRGTHVTLDDVTTRQSASVTFNFSSPTEVMVDGEVFELQPTRLDVLPSALEVIL